MICNKKSYSIEIKLYQSDEGEVHNPSEPYFWSLMSHEHNDNSDWCMENGGWSASPQGAFNDAYGYYLKYCCVD